jgi:polyisoprenyl-teichoic acid--peptidoglycan teichoic acid transferase
MDMKTNSPNVHNHKIRGWVLALAGLSFLVVLAFGSLALLSGDNDGLPPVRSTRTAAALTPIDTPMGATPIAAEPTPLPTPTIQLPDPDPWDGKSRVTILILGLDYADWEGTDRLGPPRSDAMMLLTVDPVKRTAGMLSIPRDLWVEIPNMLGMHKINTAHRFGEIYRLPGGGPGLAIRTVEQLLGVPVNYYASIDFYAFQALIDEIGGIELDVPAAIEIDPIGPGGKVVLEPGRQYLDGALALAYARNRYTPGDDFDRARRQQQVILAVRDRVLRLDMLPLLVFRAPTIYTSLSEGVRTNLSLEQMIRLAWLAREIQPGDIQRAAIGPREIMADQGPDGQSVYIPIPERIQAVRDQIFTTSEAGSSGPMTTSELVAAEHARINIVNESGDPELGEKTAAYLIENGLNVDQVVESENARTFTRLIDQTHNPYTFRRLINLLRVNPGQVWIQLDYSVNTDLTILLGRDWAETNPLQP